MNYFEYMETNELIEKLVDAGYGEFVEVLLGNNPEVYTKRDRLNKSGACRVLKWKGKQLEEAMNSCRAILCKELGEEFFPINED
jgi:hypothetical protein